MRIALVVTDFPVTSETFIVNQFAGLRARGLDVYVVCNRSQEKNWQGFPQLKEDEIRRRVRVNWSATPRWRVLFLLPILIISCLISNGSATLQYLRRGWGQFGFRVFKLFYLDAQLIRLQPDVVHFEFGTLALERMHLKEMLGCKITVSFRGYDINYAGLAVPEYYADVWCAADMLHFLGHDLHDRAIQRGLPQDKPYTLIPPSIDTAYFNSSSIAHSHKDRNSKLRILSVGRLEWIKGYEFALQALKHLLERYDGAVEYHIVGDGELYEALYFCRHQLGLEESVTFLGAVSHSQVLEEMRQADIFLHAAVSEGFCNAVLEAQAMNLPIVTSDAGGLSENVCDGITGFVVPRRDPQAIAEKLFVLANDAQLRHHMGRAGRERVQQHFRLDQQIDAFERFFQEVAIQA